MLFSIILHNLIQFVPSIDFHGDTSCSFLRELAEARAGKEAPPGLHPNFKLLRVGGAVAIWKQVS